MTDLELELSRLGIIAKPETRPQPAAYAPPQWKPTKDQPDPLF
jgi:hypothetical protein